MREIPAGWRSDVEAVCSRTFGLTLPSRLGVPTKHCGDDAEPEDFVGPETGGGRANGKVWAPEKTVDGGGGRDSSGPPALTEHPNISVWVGARPKSIPVPGPPHRVPSFSPRCWN